MAKRKTEKPSSAETADARSGPNVRREGVRRVFRQLRQTAAERYADHQKDIAILLDMIQEELRGHAARAAEDPKDWGNAADLGYVRDGLKNLLKSLIIGRHDWSEGEVSGFIENHLDAMRNE